MVWQNGICKQCRPRSDCSFRSSLIRVYSVCHSTKYFKKQLNKKQYLDQKCMGWSVLNFRTFTVYLLSLCRDPVDTFSNIRHKSKYYIVPYPSPPPISDHWVTVMDFMLKFCIKFYKLFLHRENLNTIVYEWIKKHSIFKFSVYGLKPQAENLKKSDF